MMMNPRQMGPVILAGVDFTEDFFQVGRVQQFQAAVKALPFIAHRLSQVASVLTFDPTSSTGGDAFTSMVRVASISNVSKW